MCCIDKELIKPNSPEHFDYFLGWLYRCSIEFKIKVWETIKSGENKIEFNEFYFLNNIHDELITIYSIYDVGTHNSFFASEEWSLILGFDEFRTVIGIQEMDYEKYYSTKDDCELALILLEENKQDFLISLNILMEIKGQLRLMHQHMDLNYFIPDYHLKYKLKFQENNLLSFLYELAECYLRYAKPIDIISQSRLCK